MSTTGKTMVSAPLDVAGQYPSHDNSLGKGGVHIFSTMAERDKMWSSLKDMYTVALVGVGENNFPSWYKWENNKWNFAGYFGGMVLADTDGALTHVDSTAVFGPDFEIHDAGDTGQGILIQLSAAVKADIAKKIATKPSDFGMKVGPYLELKKEKDGTESLRIKPMSFELRKTPGYLAYLQYPELLYGKAKGTQPTRRGTIWADMVRVSPEGMLQVDRDGKAIGLQETDGLDPNVTGGSKFLVWPFIYLEGTAPADGYVELIWYEKSTGNIAVDMNGHPMAVRHNYKQGQVLTPPHDPLTFAQPQTAKGLTEYSLAIIDNFDEYIKVKDFASGPSGICIQELAKDGNTSLALTQAETDTGFSVRMESYYFGTYLASINYLTSITEPAIQVAAGTRAHTVAGIEIYAITDCEFAINQGSVQASPSNKSICDFYIGLELTPEVSRIAAGEQIKAALALMDKEEGWEIGFFNYQGDLSNRPPIYSARNNGTPILNTGWNKFGSDFISEDVVSGVHSHETPDITVPKNADYVMVALYPVQAQNPLDLTLKAFHLDATNPSLHFSVNGLAITGLQHLDFMTTTVKMEQGLGIVDAMTGEKTNTFAGLRYTFNDVAEGLPMPFGVATTKLKYLELDRSLNAVSGSQATGGEGALLANEHVELTLYQKFQLYNELASNHEVSIWLMKYTDSAGKAEEVTGSRTTFTVESKRPGLDYFQTNKVTVTLEPGDYIYVRGTTDVKDGAYTNTGLGKPLAITYITEKYLG
ncbi:hypothetical protein [Vibrio phage vB_VpaS_CHI]|nr:hypothetical protein [Vibrio phage vB_VpaS_ALK]USL90133.1 hypothetical protein [Vibrio phage vB_VpaS_CHI]